MALEWPPELVIGEEDVEPWCQPGSNRVLDFHGDPIKAGLVVLSDGNHHMALLECLKVFYDRYGCRHLHRPWLGAPARHVSRKPLN